MDRGWCKNAPTRLISITDNKSQLTSEFLLPVSQQQPQQQWKCSQENCAAKKENRVSNV